MKGQNLGFPARSHILIEGGKTGKSRRTTGKGRRKMGKGKRKTGKRSRQKGEGKRKKGEGMHRSSYYDIMKDMR